MKADHDRPREGKKKRRAKADTRPVIKWNRVQDGNPPADDDVVHLVTAVTNAKPHMCSTHSGKFVPPIPDDTEPKESWLILINGEADQAEWEPPIFYNSTVIAWAEMPKPYTGEKP